MVSESTFAEWIRAHDVSWKLSPAAEMQHQGKVVVGSLLTLVARHGSAHVEPICEACILLYARLRTIAESVLPDDAGEVLCDIPPFGQTSRTHRGAASEVIFTVAIVQAERSAHFTRTGTGYSLRMIRSRLQGLGARARDADRDSPPEDSGAA